MTENKVLQLATARECGLMFPQTLVSNDPAEIRKFIGQHHRVVYKSFAPHTWRDAASGKMYVLWARLIDSDTLLDDASLSLCPGIYQTYIEKTADIRVTLIGERAFAIRIRPTGSKTLVDWRQHAVTWRSPTLAKSVQADAIVLSGELVGKLLSLMRKLGIVFGCVDLAIGLDGRTYFLEVNQSGEFLFAEEMVESVPLLHAMCCLLATARTDYSLDAIDPLSYRQYRESEHYRNWRRDVTHHGGLRKPLIMVE